MLLELNSGIRPGNVAHVEVIKVESSLYSQNDINDAIEVIKNDFVNEWDGCELFDIYYGGDELSKYESESQR